MLNQVESMFDNMTKKVKRLKKPAYEANMKAFRETYGHYLGEMTSFIDEREDKEEAAKEISLCFVNKVKEHFLVRGKIKPVTQMDLNMFMIYYVFPAILLTYHDYAKLLADTLCSTWNKQFEKTNIGYTDYQTLHGYFREKIFGIF